MGDIAERQQLDEQDFIRSKLFASDKSALRRYIDLTVGPGAGYLALIRYELITGVLGRIPGALGLALRKLVYPRLFRKCGRGVVFGCDLVIRNARNIELGDNVIIDDLCVLDGRGGGEEGLKIGSRVILGRACMIQAKIGPLSIGDDCDIGAFGVINSQGRTVLGKEIVLGGGCKVSGGGFQIYRRTDAAGDDTPAVSEQEARGQTRWSDGPVSIGDRVIAGMGCLFLDGTDVGEGVVIGAASVVNRSLPAWTVAAGVPVKVLRER